MITDHLIAIYDRPVPRYTSYPTAPHFHAGITPETATEWLQALPPEAPAPQQSPSSARPTRVHEPWRLPLSFAPSGDARATVAATAEVRFGNNFRRGRRRHGVLSVWLE